MILWMDLLKAALISSLVVISYHKFSWLDIFLLKGSEWNMINTYIQLKISVKVNQI